MFVTHQGCVTADASSPWFNMSPHERPKHMTNHSDFHNTKVRIYSISENCISKQLWVTAWNHRSDKLLFSPWRIINFSYSSVWMQHCWFPSESLNCGWSIPVRAHFLLLTCLFNFIDRTRDIELESSSVKGRIMELHGHSTMVSNMSQYLWKWMCLPKLNEK